MYRVVFRVIKGDTQGCRLWQVGDLAHERYQHLQAAREALRVEVNDSLGSIRDTWPTPGMAEAEVGQRFTVPGKYIKRDIEHMIVADAAWQIMLSAGAGRED